MNYEEKYKETLERAKKLYENANGMILKKWVEQVFPELKESEDERIRKELLEHCKNQAKPYIYTGNECPQIQSWIDWLEKQGELSICNIPSREVILAIWYLGNEWKELTNGCISTEYGTQLDYIQKHWHESEYYLRAMQDEKPIKFNNSDMIDSNLNDYCCKIYNALDKENSGVLSFARLQHLAMDIYAWCNERLQDDQIDFANKEYWRGYREGKKEMLDKYAEAEKQDK